MNTLKLKVVLLCFIFFVVGYTVANFNTLKAKFCEIKEISSVQNNDSKPSDVEQVTYGTLRTSDENISIYEVKKGDTLDSVSRLFNVSKKAIMVQNKMKTEEISEGDMIIIQISNIK
jgi:LysM repeat protein